MEDIRTFKTYNFVTGAVDGTLAYDFSSPVFEPGEEQEEELNWTRVEPEKKRRNRRREWIREEAPSEASAAAVERHRQGISLLGILGGLSVVVLITMILLAQIKLTDISTTTAELEDQIQTLELERSKLTAEYETIFNLKEVEQQAVDNLGMQVPENDQIVYLSGVASADKAVVVLQDQTDLFSTGLSDLLSSLRLFGHLGS